MNLEIITPDRKVYKGRVRSVKVPGEEGAFQILKDHASIISNLSEGDVAITATAGEHLVYTISGGVVEVKMNNIIILAESAK